MKQAILRHYWMREIGFETVALWRYYLSTHLQEVMPWYADLHNKLDEMASIFITEKSKETDSLEYGHNIRKSGTDTTTLGQQDVTTGSNKLDEKTTDTGTVTNTGSNGTTGQNLVSDTPQNGLEDVINGRYLSQAGVTSENQTTSDTEQRDLGASRNSTNNISNQMQRTATSSLEHGLTDTHGGTDLHTILREGFTGDKVDILKRYNELHLNIMESIIRDCGKYWMGILG